MAPGDTSSVLAAREEGHQENRILTDLIMDYLEQLGVEFVFGIPGGAIEPFYDALARSQQRGHIKPIVARHETGAAFMADGYHTHSGKLGVCCATTGPGTTNLITGVASAYANNVPMLVISAQTPIKTFGRGAFQESSCTGVDTLALLEPCTRFNSLVSHADQLEHKLVTAVMMAFQPIPGPVHLSIPIDIMKTSAKDRTPNYYLPKLMPSTTQADEQTIQDFSTKLVKAKKVVFIVGEGCGEAIGEIIVITKLLRAAVVTTPQGKGLISPNHGLYRGVVGFAGHKSALEALNDPKVDCIVAIGTSLNEWSHSGWDIDHLLNIDLIHVDQLSHNLAKTPMAALHVPGAIDETFKRVLRQLAPLSAFPEERIREKITQRKVGYSFTLDDPDNFNSNASPIHPARLMRDLPRILPPNTRYLADIGASFAWAIHYLHPYDRRLRGIRGYAGGLFRTCIEFSSMGWAIGSAVGTALALRNQPVACITGDGSVLMNGQEITVALEKKLPIIFIVLNDGALGMVKHGQRMTGAHPIAYEIPPVNFVDFAKAMGIPAFRIRSPDDLKHLRTINYQELDHPILLDVFIDKEAVPPIQRRTGSLQRI